MTLRALLLWLALCPVLCRAVEPHTQVTPIVEGVQCSGNLATSCELIRRQSGITVGKELDDIEVENARLRLEGLTKFRAVRIHLIKGSHKHWVIVVVDVVEASPLATAFAAGALLQWPHAAAQTAVLAGRITDYDLFGTGKSLDFAMVAARTIPDRGDDEYAARLEYRDPNLFGSNSFFFTAGLFYSQSSFNPANYVNPASGAAGESGSGSGSGLDFSVGMHLGTYSYVTVGYRYLVQMNHSGEGDDFLISDGIFTTLNSAPGDAVLITAGRNTEDDPSFPTRGWLLHAYNIFNLTSGEDKAGVLVRGTWRAGENAWWTFQARPFDSYRSLFDDDLGVSASYSHRLFADDGERSRRARWYVGPGFTSIGDHLSDGDFEVGAKGGVRFETRDFGTVNLYLIVTYPVHLHAWN
jgi:outer membrane protein assembly factor BamA